MEDELNELKALKTVQEKKMALSKEARGELEKQTELLRQVLEDKKKQIRDAKDQLRQVKKEAIREYRDSDALLAQLVTLFTEGFDDALYQAKTFYPDLDISHVTIEVSGQSIAQPILSESTKDLFVDDALVDDATVDLKGDRDAATEGQQKTVEEGSRQLMNVKKDDAPTVQQQILFLFYVNILENS